MIRLAMVLLLAGWVTPAFSQSFYLKFGGGYSFPLAAYTMGMNSLTVERIETDPETGYYVPRGFLIKESNVTGSLNSGPALSATIGYNLTRNAAVEVDLGFVSGRRYESLEEEWQRFNGEPGDLRSNRTAWRAFNVFLSPGFVLSTGEGRLKPYLKAGPLLALARIKEENSLVIEGGNAPGRTDSEQQYAGNIALGLRGTAGVEIFLTEKLSVFSEVAFLGMQYAPKEKEMLRYEINGEDVVEQWTVGQRRAVFVDDIEIDTRENTASPDEPYKTLKVHFGMSSVTAVAGLKIGL